ncbi:MAG: polysaccharide biosynthesis tyrosine autokinase [Verrucomicrobium sp.]|nr:polysaccharide biosynthesis tyrosine autokinase [Verrucomicrobium sp.]
MRAPTALKLHDMAIASDLIETPAFRDYWRVIRARSGIIFTLFLLALSTGYVVSAFLMNKQYGGTVQIRVLKNEKDIPVFDQRDPNYFDPVFFESEKETLESKEILYPIIDKLDLVRVWSQRYMHGERDLRKDEVYDLLRRHHLKIDPQRGSNIIEITVQTEDMEEAPRIANEIARQYVSSRTERETQNASRGLQSVSDQVKTQQEEVRKAKERVEDLRRKLDIDVTGLVGTSAEMQLTDQELQRKQQMLDEQRTDTEARRVRLESLKNLSDAQLLSTLPSLNLDDTNITQLQDQKFQAESNLQSLLKSGFGPEHPRVQSLRAALAKLNEQLNSLAEGKRTALQIDLQVSQEKLALLKKDVDSLRQKVREERSDKMAPYLDAVKYAETQQIILDQLNIRFKQESVDKQVTGEPALIISPAEPNPKPVRPILLLNLALAGFGGLALGLGVAFFIEHLDTSVKTIAEVESVLGVPVLALVPHGARPLNQEPPDSPFAESYRILSARIDLQNGSGPQQGNALSILSGGPGEGKSTTLFNLGYVCAQAGKSVVLVDADLRRPSLHRILGWDLAPGLSDFLEQDGPVAPYLFSTPIPNLHVVLAGSNPAEAKNRFSNQALRRMLDELKSLYQVVLIDSPPALGVSDASIICHEVDKTVLVIQHRRYPKDISLRAKHTITEVQGNLIGVVLNAVSRHADEGYYHYGAYADYYGKPTEGKKKQARRDDKKGKGGPSANGNGIHAPTPVRTEDF